jgi:hypothetical protein
MSTFSVTERTSCRYTATLKDANNVVLPLSAINTMTLTFVDVSTNTVINSRTAQDVKNTNDVTMHATSGLLTWAIQPADNAIITAGTEHELHRAVFTVVYNTTQRIVHEVYLLVENIAGVTT